MLRNDEERNEAKGHSQKFIYMIAFQFYHKIVHFIVIGKYIKI